MKLHDTVDWPAGAAEAAALQRELAAQVSHRNEVPKEPRLVAGVDISGQDHRGRVTGAVVVLRWPGMEVVEVQTVEGAPTFPYIPGLLAFREAPVLMEALERLAVTPDVIVVDGQGTAHPRRFGLACHLGLLTQLPTVGCAKSVLRGRHGPLDAARGSWAPLVDGGEVVGAALRTRDRVSPVYVSVGHKVDIAAARALVLSCCKGLRLPEPTRQAHRAAAGQLEPPNMDAVSRAESEIR